MQIKEGAKATDRLRAVERKAAKKAVKDDHGAGGKADSMSDDCYWFILEEIVSLRAQ
jgi:hypothetical protein